ncbi:MAG: nitrite reductase small subunit NirD [Actinomycetota bacterium]|nr:nitrite reductase small subunit NirD [Actinomycetota bacterium]
MALLEAPSSTWTDVCELDQILPNRGVCALVGGVQVAVFRVCHGTEEHLFAVSNFDPFSRAFVLSRGIVGSKGGRLTVASPVYKQNFDLQTGECLDDPSVCIPTFPARVVDGRVQVGGP